MALTVGQLIELLKGFPSEMPAVVCVDGYIADAVKVVYLYKAPIQPSEPITVCVSDES